MANDFQPLDRNFTIVGEDGKPNDYFIRYMQRFLDVAGSVPLSREVIAGTGLAGGGDLSTDVTLELDAALGQLNDVDLATTPPEDQQVIAFDEASGLWLPVNQSGGGGGGGTLSAASNRVASASTTGQATKGVLLRPVADFTVYNAWFLVNEVTGSSYKTMIVELSGYEITAIMGESAEVVAPASGNNARYFTFLSPVVLSAGARYALLHVRTSDGNTASSGIVGGVDDAYSLPLYPSATYVRIANAAPAIGQTLDSGSNPYNYGVTFSLGGGGGGGGGAIAKYDLSGVSSFDVEDFAGLGLGKVSITVDGTFSNDGSNFVGALKVGGSYLASGYYYQVSVTSSNSSNTNSSSSTSTSSPVVGSGTGGTWGVGNDTGENIALSIAVLSPDEPSTKKAITSSGAYFGATGNLNRAEGAIGANVSGALEGIRLSANSGTFTGRISVYAS